MDMEAVPHLAELDRIGAVVVDSAMRLGFLINFNTTLFKIGIKRMMI